MSGRLAIYAPDWRGRMSTVALPCAAIAVVVTLVGVVRGALPQVAVFDVLIGIAVTVDLTGLYVRSRLRSVAKDKDTLVVRAGARRIRVPLLEIESITLATGGRWPFRHATGVLTMSEGREVAIPLHPATGERTVHELATWLQQAPRTTLISARDARRLRRASV